MSNHNINEYITQINNLFNKYKNDEYMLNRLNYHISNILPSTLENEQKNHEKRIARNDFLSKEQQIFIQIFLTQNLYYHIPNSNFFYQYNGISYTIVSEDAIHHHILTSISKDRKILDWKHKTKITLLKTIKERNLFKSIPETTTIQLVLNKLYPTFFSSKNKAKYFLTIIGDNLLKKTNNLIFIINPKHRISLNDLDTISYLTTGHNNITNNIVSKYHESYDFSLCRLLDMNTHSNEIWRDLLNTNGINILCVATHYSTRYGNSDAFIDTCNDIYDYVMYFKINDEDKLFTTFCKKYIEDVDNTLMTNMTWKNLHYIWKIYMSKNLLPSNMIYSNKLKSLFKEQFKFDEINDTFLNITSKYLPRVSFFISFWETQIITVDLNDNIFDYELEIDEICSLFKIWIKETQNINTINNIDEQEVISILNHYFPSIEIIDNKYIVNVKSENWNKIDDMNLIITDAKKHFKKLLDSNSSNINVISFNDIYSFYLNNNSSKFTINKQYFEKYLCYSLSEYIYIDNIISIEWLE